MICFDLLQSGLFARKFLKGSVHYPYSENKSECIAPRLAHFYALQAEACRKNDDEGDEENAPAGRRQQIGTPGLAASLHHHVANHDGGTKG